MRLFIVEIEVAPKDVGSEQIAALQQAFSGKLAQEFGGVAYAAGRYLLLMLTAPLESHERELLSSYGKPVETVREIDETAPEIKITEYLSIVRGGKIEEV